MEIKNFFKLKKPKLASENDMRKQILSHQEPPKVDAAINSSRFYFHKPVPAYVERWDGERRWGELGYPLDYRPDFRNISIRSWQTFHDSDIAHTIIKNYLLWAVGKGLVLNSEPMGDMITDQETNFNRDKFVKDVETRWHLYSNSRRSSHNQMMNLHQIAMEAEKNAIIGGDVLVIMNNEKKNPTIQLVDGLHISTPVMGSHEVEAKKRGNEIKHGIEVDKKGKQIAFYVREKNNIHKRVPAYHSRTGRLLAWMVYGFRYRLDDVRGMPLLAVVLSKINSLERFNTAALTQAEEQAKVAYFIKHEMDSTNENPLSRAVQNAVNNGPHNGTVPDTAEDVNDELATKIAISVEGEVWNMPNGSELKAIKSENQSSYKDFFLINFDVVCAALGIPPEVALGKYNSNYSASRMASKTWQHKIGVDRENFANQFYKEIYQYWLKISILTNRISAPGYMSAIIKRDYELIEAYYNCSFFGANMPHVDPQKEAKAERIKLGNETIPITSFEKATRNLNEGDWQQNVNKFKQEIKQVEDLIPEEPQNNNSNE